MLEATLRDRARGLLTASGRSDVPPFMVMDVMAAAARIEAAGGHVIHMEVGQPAAPAPKTAIAAAHAALDGGADRLHLRARHSLAARSASPGTTARPTAAPSMPSGSWSPPARRARSSWRFLAMFEPGDRVAVTVPGYPPYRHILTALGCEPVLIETSSETRHALTGEALLAAHRKTPLKGVLVGSPANPTGTMMSREALTSLISAAEGAGIRFISDEIYHGLDYAFPAVTAAELSPHALVINSFSKYFCMTGWRVGWMVVPEPLVRPIERLQQNLAISVPTLSQIAAEAAFEGREEMEAGQARLPGEPPHPDRGPAARPASTNSCPPTARFTSTPTSRHSPPTVSNSPSRCWNRRMSRRPPASTSIRFTAIGSFAFPTRVRPRTCARPSRASRAGSGKRCSRAGLKQAIGARPDAAR